MNLFVAVPIRSFAAMERLAGDVDAGTRSALIRTLGTGVLTAAVTCGADIAVVTADDEVSAWAGQLGAAAIADPGGGLDAAATAAVRAAAGRVWAVVHGDLPLIEPADLTALASGPLPALAPSTDGGTSAVAGITSAFPFRFGPRSFHRHCAAVGGRCRVVTRRGLAVDVDRPRDLSVLARLGAIQQARKTQS